MSHAWVGDIIWTLESTMSNTCHQRLLYVFSLVSPMSFPFPREGGPFPYRDISFLCAKVRCVCPISSFLLSPSLYPHCVTLPSPLLSVFHSHTNDFIETPSSSACPPSPITLSLSPMTSPSPPLDRRPLSLRATERRRRRQCLLVGRKAPKTTLPSQNSPDNSWNCKTLLIHAHSSLL